MARRATVVVLDGLGAGNAPDAADFGDEGANTLANTARAVGGLDAPNLRALGLGNVERIDGVPPAGSPHASHGLMVELSAAKAQGCSDASKACGRGFPLHPHTGEAFSSGGGDVSDRSSVAVGPGASSKARWLAKG